MDQPLIPISQALNQIQSWLNAGDATRAIQGCQEVLKMEPGNMRALALLRQAYDLQAAQTPTPAPWAETHADPLHNLQVEEAPQPTAQPAPTETQVSAPTLESTPTLAELDETDDLFEQHKINLSLIWAILIPAVIAIGVIGIIGMKMSQNEPADSNGSDEITLENHDHLKENEMRVTDLQAVNTAIEQFHAEKGTYPTASEIENLIKKDATMSKMADPRHGEKDKAGNLFAYLYRVYQTAEGPNTGYTLTALFENSQGFGTEWGFGNQLESSEESRDLKFSVVIGPALDATQNETPEKEASQEESRPTGPKVKPKSE